MIYDMLTLDILHVILREKWHCKLLFVFLFDLISSHRRKNTSMPTIICYDHDHQKKNSKRSKELEHKRMRKLRLCCVKLNCLCNKHTIHCHRLWWLFSMFLFSFYIKVPLVSIWECSEAKAQRRREKKLI